MMEIIYEYSSGKSDEITYQCRHASMGRVLILVLVLVFIPTAEIGQVGYLGRVRAGQVRVG